MFESGKIYKCLNGKSVRMQPHSTYWHGYPTDEMDPLPIPYDAFGQPMTADAWGKDWGIEAVDGEPVEATGLYIGEDWGTDDYKCPHCGSTKGTWFDRSMMMSANGDVLQGMATRCSDCGEDVDAEVDTFLMLDGPNAGIAPSQRQVGGDHYKNMAIQPTDFIMANGLDWCEGNAVKYICRHSRKGGKADLEKAKHYIDLLIEKKYGGTND